MQHGGFRTAQPAPSTPSFTPRQIALKGWAGLGTPDAVRKAADVLADYDHLRRDVMQGGAAGGRPSDRYTVNPMTRSAA